MKAMIRPEDLQHALMNVDVETSRMLCKELHLPETFGDFCADDRGNVVDFYSRNGKVAMLDREAEWNGEYDKKVFYRSGASDEFMAWVAASDYAEEVAESPQGD